MDTVLYPIIINSGQDDHTEPELFCLCVNTLNELIVGRINDLRHDERNAPSSFHMDHDSRHKEVFRQTL